MNRRIIICFALGVAGWSGVAAFAGVDADMAEARSVLEAAVQAHPQNAELYVHLGFAYRKLEKADDAQKAFEKAIEIDPKKAEAHYMLGLIYEKKNINDKALSAWKSCLSAAKDEGMKDTAQRHIHRLEHASTTK